MKRKTLILLLAVLVPLAFSAVAGADQIALTLYYDWDRNGVFSAAGLTLDTETMTFTTTDGSYGDWEVFVGNIALIFRNGNCPLYAGPFHGFMTRRISACEEPPSWWFIGPPGAQALSVDPNDPLDSSGQ